MSGHHDERRFTGFGEHAVEFFDGLIADNSKAYWQDNLETYRADVRAPMEALLAELEPEFATGFGTGKVFRPHRDVRFAKDKSPYKTHCGAVIERGRGGGAYYVQISADGLLVGGGCFRLATDQLTRFRTAVAGELAGTRLVRILGTLRAKGWQVEGGKLATRPRGYPADHPRTELLRHRNIYVTRRWQPDDTLHEPECHGRVREAWLAVREFNEWAADHVGPSEEPAR
ncbi:MAG: TIGR02453 family protein [Pseudonocardiaceae bacterium]|nr:TIGR02453 family protein [Pseudonocardiaceae bacterium]